MYAIRSYYVRDREADLLLPVEVPDGLEPFPGELVLAEIAEYPSAGKEGLARIVRLLGESHTMETLTLAVTSARGLPADFSEEAMEEASRIPPSVRFAGAKKKGSESDRLPRIDQREMPFVTIDGEDARDFVITSYSIHYTKLYDSSGPIRWHLLGVLS